MFDHLYCSYKNGTLTIQRQPYIEDGWYIEVDTSIRVYEIPQFGGNAQLVDTVASLEKAFEIVKELK